MHKQFLKTVFILLVTFIVVTDVLSAVRTFTKRNINGQVSTNIRGNLLFIGNQLLCQNASNGAACTAPPIGATNNAVNQHFADIDGDGSTVNSSMARLDLQPGDRIVWARLYWSARLVKPSNATKSAARNIRFQTPLTGYTTITSTSFDFFPSTNPYDYGASADVTALVQAGGAGQYFGANIQAATGTNKFASWSLIVVVENINRTLNNISVYDGFQVLYGQSGSYPNSASIVAGGFLTPKSGAVASKLFLYSGESEAGITDSASITDTSSTGTAHILVDAQNTSNDIFNGSISTEGVYRSSFRLSDPGLANPNFQNAVGTDIDVITISELTNEQTSTTIRITSNTDRYSLNMFAFETQLYEPQFCYDYAAEQDSIPFEKIADINVTAPPIIAGTVNSGSDINVTLYLKNTENSDVSAIDVNMTIFDLNTSQVIYSRNTVTVTEQDQFLPTSKTDTLWPLVVDNANIRNIPLGKIDGDRYVYTSFALTPENSMIGQDLNLSINGTFGYTLVFPDPNGGPNINITYTSQIGSENIKLCTGGTFNYQPGIGMFNVVEKGFNLHLDGSNGQEPINNITTQVARRPGDFYIAAYNPTTLSKTKKQKTAVAVELIEIQEFQTTEAACNNPDSSISERIWVVFDDSSYSPFSKTDINAYIASEGILSLNSADDLFNKARQNTAFRIISNRTIDSDSDLPDVTINGAYFTINNLDELKGSQTTCTRPVQATINDANATTQSVSTACANATATGHTPFELRRCMECMIGFNTQATCSRDNFATRPESYTVDIYDLNQTNAAQNVHFALGHTGVVTPVTTTVDVATGYNYRFDINATSHTDNKAIPGYTRYFGTNNSDYNATLVFQNKAALTPLCADPTDYPQSFSMLSGVISQEGNHTNVGIYNFNIIDTTWTQVDENPIYMAHHDDPGFVGDRNTPDCRQDSANVPSQGTLLNKTDVENGIYSSLIGCDINSTHTNNDPFSGSGGDTTKYKDYIFEFHPYQFNLNNLLLSRGLNRDINFTIGAGGAIPFIYTANINNGVDNDMAVHYDGNITAEGFDGTRATNFTDGCYAQALQIDINRTYSRPVPIATGTSYNFRYLDYNATSGVIRNVIPNLIPGAIDITTQPIMSMPASAFVSDQNGLANISLMLNFDRNSSQQTNPITVTFFDFNISCTTGTNCQAQADLTPMYESQGTQDYGPAGIPVNHYFAETLVPLSYTTKGNDVNATIAYGIYCTNTGTNPCNIATYPYIIGNLVRPTYDIQYYINRDHNDTRDGQITAITQKTVPVFVTHRPAVNPINKQSTNGTVIQQVRYNAANGYVYTTTMEMFSPNFLLYNSANPNPTNREYKVRFLGGGLWSGVNEHNASSSKTESGFNTNRRINW